MRERERERGRERERESWGGGMSIGTKMNTSAGYEANMYMCMCRPFNIMCTMPTSTCITRNTLCSTPQRNTRVQACLP